MLSLSIKTYSPSERPSGYQHGFQENLGPIVHSLNVVELGKKPGVAAHLQLVTPLQVSFSKPSF